ncbi:flagellar hook-length control protein FliK [Microbulbifer harenosus]|uniref:Flagellar hook-length control protein FliK n=1 Tax=Microbulbifer harenosus TaxID=2576840 RepID=A0ABY2UQH6_9GAMM|nr:flagellar hook-length control protein FliK [Microbulbifer harenosus]TLM79986.1 flagellar hook-length control protein FliK [Microbulbifer harenosus]
MSGITFLLDTLLHQVLGKRVDTAAPERQPAPVKPLTPADAVQQLRSDSRLDPRRDATLFGGNENVSGKNAFVADSATGLQNVSRPKMQHAGVQLSTVARTLSELLRDTQETAPVIRPARPLADSDQPRATELATTLKFSVENSGLFYESHLLRWYRGERERLLLDSEPQMQTGAGGPSASGTPVKEESLQVLLRQQLELLATPQLRWEGEVWPGHYLELCIRMREEDGQNTGFAHRNSGSEMGDASEVFWEVDLKLVLPVVGEISLHLMMSDESLKIVAQPETPVVANLVANKIPDLHRQLDALGFIRLQLDIGSVQ